MTASVATGTLARELQAQIDVLQAELHKCVRKIVIGGNLRRNLHYTARHELIVKAIASGELPRTFWADAIIVALETTEEAGSEGGRLLGTYDAALLREHLRDMRVEYTEAGMRVTLEFAPNPFFEETVLWGEDRHYAVDNDEGEVDKEKEDNCEGKHKDDNDVRDDEGDVDDVCRFSGVTWKPGHGPEDVSDGDNADADTTKRGAGLKRERSPLTTRGWSFLEVFSKMLPHPEDDEAFDDADEDELADAVENWESEMEDRRDLLLTLVEDVWRDPVAAFTRYGEGRDNSSGPELQKTRPE
ncbi:putative nucleosome assembly protein [Trypanosoma rangeli]|uniref:Putative nucleosome assembly protein n=1 Tax=Trypanosoma rangeli TaxID=5698 RepID=A0A3R7M0B2_TRYRA|nr:putative nucleosome assembly protein [Trypanosoma rangeli]RNE97043.1 putative nucleosome assembly protein [Trypanosoma rangeli]|eukprot:RNE97043.1 putative nucleosome assembly protein [Trypanosoma rangeli]